MSQLPVFFAIYFLPKCNWASSYFCILLIPPETLSSIPFWKDLDICISTKLKIQCQIQNLYKQLVNKDNAKMYIKNDSFVHRCSYLVHLLFSSLLFFERVNYFVILQFIKEHFIIIQKRPFYFLLEDLNSLVVQLLLNYFDRLKAGIVDQQLSREGL